MSSPRAEASFTHKLANLVKQANLEDARLQRVRDDDIFRTNWDVVAAWTEESRYRRWSPEKAKVLLEAVSHRYHGIIEWIKLHW